MSRRITDVPLAHHSPLRSLSRYPPCVQLLGIFCSSFRPYHEMAYRVKINPSQVWEEGQKKSSSKTERCQSFSHLNINYIWLSIISYQSQIVAQFPLSPICYPRDHSYHSDTTHPSKSRFTSHGRPSTCFRH